MNYYLDIQLGFCSHCVTSPRWCFSTQDYIEHTINYYQKINDDDEKIIPDWFDLLYCEECKNYIEITKNICSQHLSDRILVTCYYYQNDLKTFKAREVKCSTCFWSIERKLKKHTFEEIKKLVNVSIIKRRKEE